MKITPDQIYNSTVEHTDHDIECVAYSFDTLFPELQHVMYNIKFDFIEDTKKFLVKRHFSKNVDYGERSMHLYSIWMKDDAYIEHTEYYPFMIFQCAGRGGKDHEERFITNWNKYIQAVEYIEMYIDDKFAYSKGCVVGVKDNTPELLSFYNHDVKFEKGEYLGITEHRYE